MLLVKMIRKSADVQEECSHTAAGEVDAPNNSNEADLRVAPHTSATARSKSSSGAVLPRQTLRLYVYRALAGVNRWRLSSGRSSTVDHLSQRNGTSERLARQSYIAETDTSSFGCTGSPVRFLPAHLRASLPWPRSGSLREVSSATSDGPASLCPQPSIAAAGVETFLSSNPRLSHSLPPTQPTEPQLTSACAPCPAAPACRLGPLDAADWRCRQG